MSPARGNPPLILRPQRGGTPSPDAIVFRDRTVELLRERLLAGESIVLTAEKRVGKTAVLTLLEASSAADLLIIRRDVEDVGSPKRLVETLCGDLRPHLTAKTKAATRFEAFLTKLGTTSIGPVTLPNFEPKDWRSHLDELFASAVEHLGDRPIALLWDEAPWMIDKVKRDHEWQTAADLLDALRAIRQRHPSVRFLFTGSIGFHHVLRELRGGKAHRSSINDMRQEELPPLQDDDAIELARALLRWISANRAVEIGDLDELAAEIAHRCEGIPWFIHATVDDLGNLGGSLELDAIDQVIQAACLSPSGGWQLAHYVDRLEEYYGAEAVLAGQVLDAVAERGTATPEDIAADLAHHGAPPARAQLLELLRLLHQDHYLTHDAPRWRFTYRLIRDAWIDLRDLEARPEGEPEEGG